MNPLALMIRPHDSSPHHSLALVLALTAIRASEPLPLVHIISSTPSMHDRLGGENSYRIVVGFRTFSERSREESVTSILRPDTALIVQST